MAASTRLMAPTQKEKVRACKALGSPQTHNSGYDDIVDACKQAWHFLISDPNRIRSIGTRNWARVNV
jgi:hypothetical protein